MEYRVITLGGTLRATKPEELEALLNQAAQEGWTLRETSYKPNTNQLWVILQRDGEGESMPPRRRSWLADWS
jgi:hypothetical protein